MQTVASRADEIGYVVSEDTDVLVAAAWLRDIGYAPEVVDTGFHPLDGARWLRRDTERRLMKDRNLNTQRDETEAEGTSKRLGTLIQACTPGACTLRASVWQRWGGVVRVV